MTTHAQPGVARRLDVDDQAALLPVLAAEAPITAQLVAGLRHERRALRGFLSCFFTGSTPEDSLLYVGSGIVPLRMRPGDAGLFAATLVAGRFTKASVHGLAPLVAELWAELGPAWGPAKEERTRQLLLECVEAADGSGRRPHGVGPLRLAVPAEFARVLPAAAAMYLEELGSDPLDGPYAAAYQRRVHRYLDHGLTWVCADRETGEIAFKADVVGREFGAATIQGVWTHPRHRGEGLATSAMTTLAALLLEARHVPNLVVNEHNTAARAVYARAGFVAVERYATIMF